MTKMTQTDPTRRHLLQLMAGSALVSCTAPEPPKAQTQNTERVANSSAWRTGVALPFAVQEIYPCLHNGRIHLAGGLYAPAGPIIGATDRHISWAPGELEWHEETPLPLPLHHPQLISYQGSLILLGGFAREQDAGWIMQSACFKLVDLEANDRPVEMQSRALQSPQVSSLKAWSPLADLPQPNGESVTAVLENRLHVCSGRIPTGSRNATWQDHTDTDAHFVLTGLGGDWQTAAPVPTARNSAAAAIIDGHWHVVGGRTVADGNTPAHEVYDAREDRWRKAAPMPQGQGGLAAASVGGKLYAFGGEYFNNGGGVYKESWVYDPASDAWTAIANMPNPRHGLGAVAIENDIYVIGGALKAGGSETSNLVEVFTP